MTDDTVGPGRHVLVDDAGRPDDGRPGRLLDDTWITPVGGRHRTTAGRLPSVDDTGRPDGRRTSLVGRSRMTADDTG